MKTKYLVILLCAAFVLPGCNDSFLDRIPLDELPMKHIGKPRNI